MPVTSTTYEKLAAWQATMEGEMRSLGVYDQETLPGIREQILAYVGKELDEIVKDEDELDAGRLSVEASVFWEGISAGLQLARRDLELAVQEGLTTPEILGRPLFAEAK